MLFECAQRSQNNIYLVITLIMFNKTCMYIDDIIIINLSSLKAETNIKILL